MSKYTFPVLETPEIVAMLQNCDFSLATEENISRPTSEYVITLYKQIIESYMGMSADNLLSIGAPTKLGSGDQFGQNEEHEGIYQETLHVLVLNKICYKFFQNIGVDDFNISDLYKPETQRLRKLLSAVVNYARFRGERIEDCTGVIEKSEQLLSDLISKFDRYNMLQKLIKQYQDESEVQNVELPNNGNINDLTELEKANENLELQLKNLTRIQETFSIDYQSYKQEKQKLLTQLEQLGFQTVELDSEFKKLKKYIQTDKDELNNVTTELKSLLNKKKEDVKNLEIKQQNLVIAVQTFQKVIEELYDVIQLLSTDLQESHRNELDLLEFKQQLLMRIEKMKGVLSNGIAYKLTLLQEQLQAQNEKLQNLESTTTDQTIENEKKIKELKTKYSEELIPEINEQEEYIKNDLMVNVVGTIEAEIEKMREDFEKEAEAVELEYSLLANHINDYMEQMISKKQ